MKKILFITLTMLLMPPILAVDTPTLSRHISSVEGSTPSRNSSGEFPSRNSSSVGGSRTPSRNSSKESIDLDDLRNSSEITFLTNPSESEESELYSSDEDEIIPSLDRLNLSGNNLKPIDIQLMANAQLHGLCYFETQVPNAPVTTPLIEAVKKSDKIKMQMLLSFDNVDANEEDFLGRSALFYALQKNDPEILDILLKHGASIDVTYTFVLQNPISIGQTLYYGKEVHPIHIATQQNNQSGIEILCAMNKKCINHQDNNGNTPLHVSVEYDDNAALVEFLLSKQPNLFLENNYGLTSYEYALKMDRNQSASLLKHALDTVINRLKFKNNQPLFYESFKEFDLPTIQKLIRLGADLKNKNDQALTPLLYCIKNSKIMANSLEKIKLLINEETVNLGDDLGFAPLHYVVLQSINDEHLGLVDLLINKGADIDQQSSCGYTPLHIACLLNNPQVVEHLLKNDAVKNILTTNGSLPVDLTGSQEVRQKFSQSAA